MGTGERRHPPRREIPPRTQPPIPKAYFIPHNDRMPLAQRPEDCELVHASQPEERP